mmetsp:Transcript_10835/g.17364  ORF Transcript_10835/g.17364 Transcript_10835/m.17364 type:complete len:110 (-) Transcript_10835:103-432(-)
MPSTRVTDHGCTLGAFVAGEAVAGEDVTAAGEAVGVADGAPVLGVIVGIAVCPAANGLDVIGHSVGEDVGVVIGDEVGATLGLLVGMAASDTASGEARYTPGFCPPQIE